jgi:hypothetical protein
MLAWLISAAFAGDLLDNPPETIVLPAADLVIAGKVASASPGERVRIWDLARGADFGVMLPGPVLAVVCVKVTEVLYGDFMGDKACFYRVSGLSLGTEDMTGTGDQVVGRDAIWLLRESAVGPRFFFARDREAVQPIADLAPIKRRVNDTRGLSSLATPATPTRDGAMDSKLIADMLGVYDLAAVPALREALAKGAPAERVAVIDAIAEFGILPLVADLVAHVDDAERVVGPGDPIGVPVGVHAVDALLRLSSRLDGRLDSERPRDVYAYSAEGIDFSSRSAAVRGTWEAWWTEWKAKGPIR